MQLEIKSQSIATVKNTRTKSVDDNWETSIADIELAENTPFEALNNITRFPHLEIICYFDKVKKKILLFLDDQEVTQIIR